MIAADTRAALPAAEPVVHPPWCAPDRCTVAPGADPEDTAHLSAAIELDTAVTTRGLVDVDLWLHQGAAGGDSYLVIDVIGTRERAMVALPAAAAALRHITQLLATALPAPAATTQEGADQA